MSCKKTPILRYLSETYSNWKSFAILGKMYKPRSGSGTFYPAVSGDDGVVEDDILRSTNGDGWFGNRGSGYAHFWLRFVDVIIPKGATIITAYFTCRAANTDTGMGCNMIMYCNDIDDSNAPTTASEFNLLDLTSGTNWNDIPAWTSGVYYDSIELKDEVQEVVNRVGFTPGNAITIIGRTNSPTEERFLNFIDYGNGSRKPRLYVEWMS